MFTTTLFFLSLLSLFSLQADAAHSSPRRAQHAKRITGWDWKGCAMDSDSPRALAATSFDDAKMTAELCTSRCGTAGYSYAGLEYGTQCWCANSVSGPLVTAADCNVKCGGNSAEVCGGSWRLSVYAKTGAAYPFTSTYRPPASTTTTTVKTSTTTTTSVKTTTSAATTTTTATGPIPTASSLGCYSDPSSSRTLTVEKDITNMTPALCLSYCGGQGYAYAGFEYGHQCWCGNSLASSRLVTGSAATSGCSMACDGDKSSMCGGGNFLNAWSVPPCANGLKTNCNVKVTTYTAPASTSATTTTKATSVAASTTSSTYQASCTGTCASDVGVDTPVAASATRALYAHHMVGNTYSYTQATWADDISQAYAAGIDGFALNIGADSYEPSRVADAYAAAKAQGKFKLFYSLDVSSLGCSSSNDAANVANMIATYASHTAQATYSGKTLVSTFAGENCYWGQGSALAGWNYVRQLLTAQKVTMYLVPAVFSDPGTFSSASMAYLDGEFNWNGGWPMGKTPLDTSSDTTYMADLGSKTYMAAISPLFFTYYGPNSYNKNWIYRSDDWLLARRFEQLVGMRDKIPLAEIISWNDYGESHYIGPIRTDQPNSQGWTNGMPHTAWLSLIAYYAPAFKTGVYPTPSTDSIWLWSRPHPKNATPTAPTNARPTNADYTDDNLYGLVVLASPATVVISSGTNSGTWNLPKGLSKISVSSAAGVIKGSITRSGKAVKSYDSTGSFTYTLTPTDYNFNYFVASA